MLALRTLAGPALAALLTAPASAQTADLILHDANVVTLAGEGARAEAIAIAGNRILAVGEAASVLAHGTDVTELIDLDGATVVPGMIDNHVHYVRAAGGDPERFAAIAAQLNAAGVTAVVDAAGFNFTTALTDAVRDLEAGDRLTVRVFQMAWPGRPSPQEAVGALTQLLAERDEDGLVQSAGVGEALYRPMHDNPARDFAPTQEDLAVAAALLEVLAASGTRLHLHSRTEAGTRAFLDLFERAAPGAAARLGWTLHHLENVTPETIEKIAAVGAQAALHPRGPRTASIDGATSLRPPVGLFEEAGIVWGLGTDATGGGRGVLELLAFAAGEGQPEGVENTVSREAALRAVTSGNARLIGRGDALGTLEPGKLADIAVLDRDVTDAATEIAGTNVLMTILDGAIVYRAGI